MHKKFWEFQDKIKKIREKKEEWKGKRSVERIKAMSLMMEKHFSFNNKINIPYPNLWAEAEVQKRFGGVQNVDFDDPAHIAEMLFILEKQHNDVIPNLTEEEYGQKIREKMQIIPSAQKANYGRALYEMYAALKKNSIAQQRAILQEALATVQHGLGRKLH
jgi:hypothetical protein